MQQTLSQSGTAVANYSWLADGTKCGVVDNTTNGFDYLGSLIYSRSGSTRTLESTDFGGGRIVYSGGTYNPYYYITDHLGSVRVITNNSGTIVEQNDYYPFGGKHANGNYLQLPVNKQKFNGKELQTTGGTGFLDYGARMYDDVIGRWSVVDPLGEKYYNISPYVYCFDSPLKYTDFDGRDPGDVFKTIKVAAIDWGMYYNGASILRQKEFGSKIYEVKKDGKVIGYSYSVAKEGNAHNVTPSDSPNGEKVLADIHSHGNDDIDYDDNHFSHTDKEDNDKKKINGYLASPNGSLQEYNSITKKTTIVSTDLPSDPHDPDRKNKNNPTDIPKEKQRTAKPVKQDKILKPDIHVNKKEN